MANEFSRTRRVGEQIKRELAPLVQEFARDRRLGLVSITGVDISPDLRNAIVFVSRIGSALEPEEVVAALNAHERRFREHLFHNLRIRNVPVLHFRFDESVEHGAHMSHLLRSLVKGDEAEDGTEEV